MELLEKFKENGYFTAELYNLLATKKLGGISEEITGSEYLKEMQLTTNERLKNLNKIVVKNIVTGGKKPDKIVLSFTPTIIVFQNFKPNDRIVAKFSVKNVSKAPTFISMVYKETTYFSIKPCGGELLSRLAPGISVTFAITFVPVQYEDYTHKVTFYTDIDQYVLPIIAMGPRPLFDFPDQVILPKIPLKVESFETITIHNTGVISAGFTMNTRSPFSVHPKSAYLNPGEKIDVKIGFKTMHLGETHGRLYAVFETGEKFLIKLSGTTHLVNIELEKNVVRFSETYNTMVRQQTFKITNKSDHLLTFMCMKNECIVNDFEEKVKLATICYNLKDTEIAKNRKLTEYDVVSSEDHTRVYTRIFFDEIQALVADESLMFQNMHYSLMPLTGNIWPNKSTELTISFNPKEIGDFEATVYLDLDGVFERFPLKMVGTSLPPSVTLNLETLDMDTVYINKSYNYEIVAINKGHINGVIVYKDVPTLFGSRITCTPELHCLKPGDKEAFIITFSNANQGPYFEEINFIIRDTNVVLKVYLKGEVIYPSLMFSVSCLDFGMVSLGVPKTLQLDVINESIVNVSAFLKISSDGPEVSAYTIEDYRFATKPKAIVPTRPREFEIYPSKIDLTPESRVSLKVTLTANLIRVNRTSLEMELEKSDSPPIILPVLFNAKVPEITPAEDINIRACFRDYVYQKDIFIKSNEFWGYFTVEEPEQQSTLHVNSIIKEGTIEPNSTLCLPIEIETNELGPQEYCLRLNLFGLLEPIEICKITGFGVRPIVTCTPTSLHWGQVKLLTKSNKTLCVLNDSPVAVYFKASLLNRDGRWNIYPSEGMIEAESEIDLLVSLYLIDAASYTNKAVIQLERVKDILVPLSAVGIGTSILVGELRDKVMLGRHFTKIPLCQKIILENCGSRLHVLDWSEHYKQPKTKQSSSGAFFNLEPKSFKMAAGEKIELTITGLSHKVTTVKDTWFLIGSIEGVNKKELLLECPIVAEFVDPKVELSTSYIELQYDYGPYSEFYKLTDLVSIKNISKLPLDLELSLKPPFAMIQKNTYKVSSEEEHMCCCICYDKSDVDAAKMIKEVGYQRSKQFIDYLTLKPVDPLREGSLQFFQDINKIKMAFSLTHCIEECLEDQESMKIQILFDTTKHTNLKSKVYYDLMRVKFRGHRNKDAVRIVGKINFPNIFIQPSRLDFQCSLINSVTSKTIKIQNVTPLLACFRFQWKKCYISNLSVPEPLVTKAPSSTILTLTVEEEEPLQNDIQEIFVTNIPEASGEKLPNKDDVKPSEIFQSPEEIIVDDSEESELEYEFMKKRIVQKITPMLKTDIYETEFEWMYKFPEHAGSSLNVNEMFILAPHRGNLKQNEVQDIHIMFKPKPNVSIKGLLECEVLGGPSEFVIVTGQSSELRYDINTKRINFRIRSFHENATEVLIITNKAPLVFEYRTYLNEPSPRNELEGTILNLMPPNKELDDEEEMAMEILVAPGVIGYFNRVFILQIGHLPYIPIEVFGWGVIPQVYLSLPRLGMKEFPVILGYQAITPLTVEYLDAVGEIFASNVHTSEHLNSPVIDKCFDDPDLRRDWHICSPWDGFPNIMDIELAIERYQAINHIKTKPEILANYATSNKSGPLPGFLTSPYVVDFGVIITGSTVQCVAEVINYGPIQTKLHFSKGTKVPPWLNLKLCGKLNPGETGKLEIVFTPTSEDFTELEQNVETSFYLEVPYGVTIPVVIRAMCAVPYLASNIKEIDFGTVRCGDKVIYSMPLKNM